MRDRPELREAPVVGHDAPREVHDEDPVRGRLERRLEQGERAADRRVRVLARESGRDVLRDVRQEAGLALAEADGAAVALDDESPEDAGAGLQRHADPVERGGADLLDLVPVHEVLEELRRGEEGPARADHVLRQAAAEGLRRGRRVELVHEVGKAQELLVFVPERDVEISRVDEVAHERVDRRVELVEVPRLLGGLRDARARLLEGRGSLAFEGAREDLREERQGAHGFLGPVRLAADGREAEGAEELLRRADRDEEERLHADGLGGRALGGGLGWQVGDPRGVDDLVPPHPREGPREFLGLDRVQVGGGEAVDLPARGGCEARAVLRGKPQRHRVRTEEARRRPRRPFRSRRRSPRWARARTRSRSPSRGPRGQRPARGPPRRRRGGRRPRWSPRAAWAVPFSGAGLVYHLGIMFRRRQRGVG